jgi:hypothetical protein
MNGIFDEQFLVGLSNKVHRGQEGRVRNGMLPGGKCYGYKNVPIEDFSRKGDYGRPAVIGVRQEIVEEEANAVRRMFDMYGGGLSLATIAKTFNAEGIPAPRPRRGRLRAWSPNCIHSMIRNQRYRGWVIWNRTRRVRNPETGRKQERPRPREDWVIVETPELRIVSDEQWERVQAQIKIKGERFGAPRLGGLNRTEQSKEYLFSSLMICALCGYRMVIVAGTGKNASYGCPVNRYKGVCPNDLRIRRNRLESQLIDELIERALRPEMLEHAIEEFQNQFERESAQYLRDCQSAEAQRPKLVAELRKLESEINNLSSAIAQYGTYQSPALLSLLSAAEDRKATLERRLGEAKPVLQSVPIDRVRDFVYEKATDLKSILLSDPKRAKIALRNHFKPLVLSPKLRPDGPVYSAEGTFDLLSEEEAVMLLASPTDFNN